LGKIAKSPEIQGRRRFCERGVLTCTVRSKNARSGRATENAVVQDEFAISNSAIAEFGDELPINSVYQGDQDGINKMANQCLRNN
jgi:hypothetical protein